MLRGATMTTEEQIGESLDSILIPGVMRNLLKMNLARSITINDSQASINLSAEICLMTV
jgi:metal-sulfur cluster biosynthetic enzyme